MAKEEERNILYVRCEQELKDACEEAARQDGRSVGDWIRRQLRDVTGLPVVHPPREKKKLAHRKRLG